MDRQEGFLVFVGALENCAASFGAIYV